jgi:hypothetical protein
VDSDEGNRDPVSGSAVVGGGEGQSAPPPSELDDRAGGAAVGRRRAPKRGPQVRETWLHRRERNIKIDVAYLEDLTSYARDELIQFAVGQFMLAFGISLAAEKLIESGNWTSQVTMYVAIAVAGAVVWIFGWRAQDRRRARIAKLLGTVEDEEQVS